MRAAFPLVLVLIAPVALAAPAAADPAADAALIRAVYDGDLRRMQDALRAGASFNARDENGYTPLHWAAFRGYGVLAGYMLDRGATVDVPDRNGYTPLMLAAFNNHDTVVRLLLARGASRDRRSQDGFTAWDYAKARGHAALLPLLQPTRTATPPARPTAAPFYAPSEAWTGATPAPVAETPTPMTAETPGPDTPEWLALPTPTPSPTPTPVATPRVGPTPTPAPPGHALEAVAGMHLSRISFPIAGLHYRHALHDWVSARVGAEYGRTQAAKTGDLALGFTRLHAALLTNGWLYVGAGATHITLGTLYAGGYNPSALSWDAIGGLRYGAGPLSASAEFRFGVGGPSTATGGAGLRF